MKKPNLEEKFTLALSFSLWSAGPTAEPVVRREYLGAGDRFELPKPWQQGSKMGRSVVPMPAAAACLP